jgi:hypothetical protein
VAGIDKTYGTVEQSIQMWNWLKRHRPKFLRYHYGLYFLDAKGIPIIGEDGSIQQQAIILNTTISADKWLVRYCPFDFVLQRFVEVYSNQHIVGQIARKRIKHGSQTTN